MPGKQDIQLIAETAWHHQGDFDFMKELVTKLSQSACADIIKMHITLDFDEYMSNSHPLYETLKGMTFDEGQWNELVQVVRTHDKKLMSLVNDARAAELAVQAHAELMEVHAVCLNDLDLLDAVKQNIDNQTDLVLGVGGSSMYEIDHAINYLQHDRVVLMFGFQSYPTNYADINFNKIRRIMSMYPEFRFGYADHTAWDHTDNQLVSLLGTALGMDYLEKHVTTHYGEDRIDWQAAISVEQCKELHAKLQILKQCQGDGALEMSEPEKAYGHYGPMKKAAMLVRNVKQGDRFKRSDIAFKRCGTETDLSQIEVFELLSRDFVYQRELAPGDVIGKGDLERVEQ
ncbi:MAG: N-acetylneuraminate synthase family protein [Gammaproteobacteria bacterium]|nr:N-acetylneuraminate synthase family protein [Gammaproteobacteria bacterium]